METERRADYSTRREESYCESEHETGEQERMREYIKYIIMLPWAMCLLILLQLGCNEQTQRKLTLHAALQKFPAGAEKELLNKSYLCLC